MVVSTIFYLYHYLGKWSNLTNIFLDGLKPPTINGFLSSFCLTDWKFWQSSRGQKGDFFPREEMAKLKVGMIFCWTFDFFSPDKWADSEGLLYFLDFWFSSLSNVVIYIEFYHVWIPPKHANIAFKQVIFPFGSEFEMRHAAAFACLWCLMGWANTGEWQATKNTA